MLQHTSMLCLYREKQILYNSTRGRLRKPRRLGKNCLEYIFEAAAASALALNACSATKTHSEFS